MKLVSFNVNSIRSRLHQLTAVIEAYQPEIIGLQETKVVDGAFPAEAVQELGYHAYYHGQKTHYGVALLCKKPPLRVVKGFPGEAPKSQRRFIAATFAHDDGSHFHVINGYFPQGESRDHPLKFPAKRQFYQDLQAYLEREHRRETPLVVMGDFNIAPGDEDIGIGETNARRWLRTGKCSFLPEEREWFDRLLGWGLTDSYRHRFPGVHDRFSWFDYRSRGFDDDPKRGLRIDMILTSETLVDRVADAGIDYRIRAMEKPSDHCPVWVELDM